MTSTAAYREPNQRIPELDGLRGLAVGAVLLWHFVGAMIDTNLGAWTKVVYHTTILGRTGVDLFFVLSGFLITGIILERKQAPFQFLRNFYCRRALRILPSYGLLIFLFSLVVIAGVNNSAFNTSIPWWRYFTFTQNLWMASHDVWGPDAVSVTWSVAIEEQFYFVFPFIAIVVPRRSLPVTLISIALASIFFRAFAFAGLHSAFTMYVHTLARLDGLAIGALIACFWRSPNFDSWLLAHSVAFKRWQYAMVGGFLILGLSMAGNLSKTMAWWGHTYLTLFYGTCLVCLLSSLRTDKTAWLRDRTLGSLGRISYTVYLFHPLFITTVFLLARRPERLSSVLDVILAGTALSITICFSFVSLHYMEKPLIDSGRRLTY